MSVCLSDTEVSGLCECVRVGGEGLCCQVQLSDMCIP